MITTLCPLPKIQFFSDAGVPLAGGKLYTYVAGQPGVFKATYTDATGTAYNANPIILDSGGRASVWLDGYYFMRLEDALGNTIWTQDNVCGPGFDGVLANADLFFNVYQGAKAADPTERPDGTPLQPGDLYFNTVNDVMMIYSGTEWSSNLAGVAIKSTHSGDSSTTVFTMAQAPSYSNCESVFISGVYQQKSAYTISGTTITFSEAPPSGTNNIEIILNNTAAISDVAFYSGYATGLTTAPNQAVHYQKIGSTVTIFLENGLAGTSNSVNFTITGMPVAIRPTTQQIIYVRTSDNGANYVLAMAQVETTGVITLFKDAHGNLFTASGPKSVAPFTATYLIV